jgi:hypothetical protein
MYVGDRSRDGSVLLPACLACAACACATCTQGPVWPENFTLSLASMCAGVPPVLLRSFRELLGCSEDMAPLCRRHGAGLLLWTPGLLSELAWCCAGWAASILARAIAATQATASTWRCGAALRVNHAKHRSARGLRVPGAAPILVSADQSGHKSAARDVDVAGTFYLAMPGLTLSITACTCIPCASILLSSGLRQSRFTMLLAATGSSVQTRVQV